LTAEKPLPVPAHSRGLLHPKQAKIGLAGDPGLCHTILVFFRVLFAQRVFSQPLMPLGYLIAHCELDAIKR
jgi:hypothetical protein